jgi:hypothetical protein
MAAEQPTMMVDLEEPTPKQVRGVTAQLYDALDKRYGPPAYALIRSVSDATGFQRWRTADAIAMSIWPSRGLDLMGFELKVNRYDWLRELKDPSKADGIFRFCDRWWLVTNDPKVAQMSEIPPPWGWLCLFGNRWRVLKEAPKLKSKPISREFLASLLRHVNDQPNTELAEAEEKGYQRGLALGRDTQKHNYERLRAAVDTFERQSGIKIDGWGLGDIGAAVERFIRHERHEQEIQRSLVYLRTSATRIVESIDQEMREVEQWQATKTPNVSN